MIAVRLQCSFIVIALLKFLDVFVSLITHNFKYHMLLKVSNKYFKSNTFIMHGMRQITFGSYTVTTCNFYVITIHYISIVLTSALPIYAH